MSNLKTLKPFQKGNDPRRNTKGRPKGSVSSFDEIIERKLNEVVITSSGEKVNVMTLIIMRLINDARNGSLSAMKLFFNYAYGKPVGYCPRCDSYVTQTFKKEQSEKEREMYNKKLAKAEKDIGKWIKKWESKK